ncbi:MAG: arginine--tRNA ligase [Firmicutes bacterium]|nr:arginine--tRNA ligase [Bacillota bacterium]
MNKQHIQNLLVNQAKVPQDMVVGAIEIPESTMGDFSFPVFKLAKIYKKSPNIIAQEISSNIDDVEIARVQAINGYVNFYLDRDKFVGNVLRSFDLSQKTFGNGHTICIDYSSINIAKPMHIGHLSSTAIGGSLYQMYKYLGYNVVGINYLGDWGTQFGKLIYAYLTWGNRQDILDRGIEGLLELYVKFHDCAEQDKSIEDSAREWFLKIEQGDIQALELFEWFKEITLKEVAKVYDMLDISFDSYKGESFFNDKIQPIVKELMDKGLLVESDGAKVVQLQDDMPPALILRRDGASLYVTRDLAAAKYRKETYNFSKCLYVVAYQQNLHFKQVFGVLDKMGYEWAKDCLHIPFGMVSLKNGDTLSSRKGKVVFLEKILKDAIQKALVTIEQKNPNLKDKDSVAKMVGIGAVVFGALSTDRIKDIVFDIDKALQFEGETGPYLQYTHARCCSILSKCGQDTLSPYSTDETIKCRGVDTDTFELVKLISRLDETIIVACNRYEPSLLARLLLDIAQAFNKFYITNHILSAETDVYSFRLQIVKLTQQVLKLGMSLLLLKSPIEM